MDTQTMDAVKTEETDDKEKDNKVATELSAGYSLNGKVIRPARVAVYKFNSK
jgi:molecular chaperone GrpE (heat shock protein)